MTHTINMGELVAIPDEVIAEMAECRLKEASKRPFTEIHRHFTVSRRADNKSAKTKAAIAQAFKVAALETPPPPLTGPLANRCPSCSLLPICLPEEVRQLRSQR